MKNKGIGNVTCRFICDFYKFVFIKQYNSYKKNYISKLPNIINLSLIKVGSFFFIFSSFQFSKLKKSKPLKPVLVF